MNFLDHLTSTQQFGLVWIAMVCAVTLIICISASRENS